MFLTRPSILLIDDDYDDTEILSEYLLALGTESKSFASGEKALIYLDSLMQKSELPALVILDYNMPSRNGLEILSGIKSNPGTMCIPVIMYSTSITSKFQKELLKTGAYACYIKPFTFTESKVHARIFARLAGYFSRVNEQEKYSINTA